VSETFETVLRLVQQDQVLVSEHGYDELAEDNIYIKDIMAGINKGIERAMRASFTEGR